MNPENPRSQYEDPEIVPLLLESEVVAPEIIEKIESLRFINKGWNIEL